MKTLYFECKMGASGNMLLGALLDLFDDAEEQLERLNSLGIHGVRYELVPRREPGRLVRVTVGGHDEDEEHPHCHGSSLPEILSLIDDLAVSETVRAQARDVYGAIAEAEAAVHGTAPAEVHFHEVGSLDAVADVTGVCLLLETIGAERVLCSPIHVGNGTVRCAHGVLPVPAPAAERLLRGIPWYTGEIDSELCTPTGAALLRQFAQGFGPMPAMRVERCGCGFGTKEFDRPNCVRAFFGETDPGSGEVFELKCDLDDMTGEELAFAREKLETAGALDVSMIATMRKKNRPGFLLTCLCRAEQREELVRLLLTHTTTAGVRWSSWQRAVMETSFRSVETALGPVREKQYRWGSLQKEKAEYDDLARAARVAGVTLREARDAFEAARRTDGE